MRYCSLLNAATTALLVLRAASVAAQSPSASAKPEAFHLMEATVDDVRGVLQSGRATCRGLVELYLKRIETYDKAGPALNAVQTINPRARQEADRLDAAFKSSGPVGPLHCIPVLVKDQVDTSDMPTTYGSAVFKDFVPGKDATIVTRLRQAGAVIVGKATMGEYASGYFGSASGPIRNAYDPSRNASGSSGGTGSGIAANFATVGIGEDTGGSIRGPAAVSSLVGLRPTLPLVSRHGMFPARPTTDTLGPITRTVRDAAIVLDVIAGYDSNDPVTAYAVGQIPTSYTSSLALDGLRGARIGVIRQPMDAKADVTSDDYRKVRAVIDRAIGDLKALGAEVVDPVTIPGVVDRVTRVYDGNVFETESAINDFLAQHANAPVKTLRDILLSGKVVPSRVRALMSSVGKSTEDAGYRQVVLAAENTRQMVLTLMADNKLDVLVYATFDHQPPRIASDVMTKSVVDDVTGPGNNRRLSPALGFPALTVPAGFTTDGLPVGLEFMGRPYAEAAMFKFAYAYEQKTHHRKPPASTPGLRGEP
jgi:amidase